ncbi:MAG TPA: mechanosensitive ion channel family protein [Thermoanaerobaculia bacterium]|nr:mechanosensitive ion channel family protein [Thermoanaerobaculia bacterium]
MLKVPSEIALSNYFFEQVLFVMFGIGIAYLLVKKERPAISRIFALYLISIALRFLAALAVIQSYGATTRVLAVLILVFQGIVFLNLCAIVLFSIVLRAVRLEPPRILQDLAIAFSYIGLVLFLFSQYKVDVSGIIATSAVITAVVGFSLQDTLGNVMGGVALQVDKSIAPGDWIRFGEAAGIVREINWRHVTVESRNGDRFIVPNGLLMKNQVMVQGKRWAATVQERRSVFFSVDFNHSPTSIMDAVTDALTREPIDHVAAEPRPDVILLEFAESAARYAVRYWLTDLAQDEVIDSAIRTRIHFALKRSKVPFSLPSSHVFLSRPEDAKPLPLGEPTTGRRIADLKAVSIFQSLTEEELRRTSEELIYSPFVPGEAILVQGHDVHHLYILTRGSVEVRISLDDGKSSPVATLDAPNFFGEGGMLTGEPRRATIVAVTEVECWRLEKDRFEEILRARPAIADEISHLLAERNVELSEVRDGLSEEAKRQHRDRENESLRERIGRFFGV